MDISDNDYSEGAWTPIIEGTSAAGAGTYNPQTGAYVKIGKLVHVNFTLGWSAHTGTGNMILAGLPFANAASGVVSLQHSNLTSPASSIVQGRLSGSTIILESVAVAGGAAAALAIDTAGTLRGTLTYMTNG